MSGPNDVCLFPKPAGPTANDPRLGELCAPAAASDFFAAYYPDEARLSTLTAAIVAGAFFAPIEPPAAPPVVTTLEWLPNYPQPASARPAPQSAGMVAPFKVELPFWRPSYPDSTQPPVQRQRWVAAFFAPAGTPLPHLLSWQPSYPPSIAVRQRVLPQSLFEPTKLVLPNWAPSYPNSTQPVLRPRWVPMLFAPASTPLPHLLAWAARYPDRLERRAPPSDPAFLAYSPAVTQWGIDAGLSWLPDFESRFFTRTPAINYSVGPLAPAPDPIPPLLGEWSPILPPFRSVPAYAMQESSIETIEPIPNPPPAGGGLVVKYGRRQYWVDPKPDWLLD